MKIEETLRLLESAQMKELFQKLYGEASVEESIVRYQELVKKFNEEFGE